MHLAIYTRDIEICKLIIKYIGNINSRCNTGETALHLSTNLRLFDISKLLVDNDTYLKTAFMNSLDDFGNPYAFNVHKLDIEDINQHQKDCFKISPNSPFNFYISPHNKVFNN